MKLLKRRKEGVSAIQTARGAPSRPITARAPRRAEAALCAALRDAVPILDAAISKITRLLGTFEVFCRDPLAERRLRGFLADLPVGAARVGAGGLVSSTVDRFLTAGTAVNELVFTRSGKLSAVYPVPLCDVELSPDEDLLSLRVTAKNKPLPHPERIAVTSLNPDAGEVYGKPLISGLAAVSETLLKIYDCIGVNFERLGNPRFAVISRAEDCSDGDSRAREMAEAWSEAMGDKHSVRDFVAVGDVEIKVIGAENAIPDITVPVRALLEQIIAKTGLPPFLLGLSWSSTEKMSQQQADILTSELEYYRELVNPLIMRVCRAFLYGIGCFEDPEIVWSNISLQDEKELAEARYYNARAERLERGEGE